MTIPAVLSGLHCSDPSTAQFISLEALSAGPVAPSWLTFVPVRSTR